MNLLSKRGVEPLSLELTLLLEEPDLLAAFDIAGPDEHLFFSAFSSAWGHLSASDKLSVVSRIAALAESASPLVTPERIDELTERLDASGRVLSEEVNPNR